MKRVLSGIQPTGHLHLGNYLGALINWAPLQEQADEALYCIVDLHAITVWQDPQELSHNIREVTAAIIASGVDVNKSILFAQSHVPAHSQMAWIMNCIARMGWLNRMTQFKDKAGKNKEKVSVGLFTYPCLMAADILTNKATHIPVGEDQKQHLELARDISQKFNHDFNVDFFPDVEPLIQKTAARIMSLRDGQKKMSKSDPSDYSRINISDEADVIAQKIRKAKTDPEPIPDCETGLDNRPEVKNLISIYAALAQQTPQKVCESFAGQNFSCFKQELIEILDSHLSPVRTEMKKLCQDPHTIDKILYEGAKKAHKVSAPIVSDILEIMGFIPKK